MDWRWENPKVERIFADYLNLEKPDLVHFHCIQRITNSAVEATRAADIPYLVTVHDGWWISDHQFLVDEVGNLQLPDACDLLKSISERRSTTQSLRRLAALRRSLEGAQAVLAVSDSFANPYRKAGIGNIISIPNGVSQISWHERQPSPGRVRLGHIGGMSKHKGFHLVRRAVATGKFRNLELTIVDHGAPSGSERLETWGTTPVRIIGKVPQEEIADLYAQLDVLLAPSTWPESFGLVVREALAAGVWVVTSDLGAMSEPVEHGSNGFLVDVSSCRALREAMRHFDENPLSVLSSPKTTHTIRLAVDQSRDLVAIYQKLATTREVNETKV